MESRHNKENRGRIKHLIRKNRLKEACLLFEDTAFSKEAIALHGQVEAIEHHNRQGLLSQDQFFTMVNGVRKRLLELCKDEIPKNASWPQDQKVGPNKQLAKWLTAIPPFEDEVMGRDKDLSELSHILKTNTGATLVQGMGGIGKTTLAIEYLNQYKDNYDHIVWIDQLGDFSSSLLGNRLLLWNLDILTLPEDNPQSLQLILNRLANIQGKCLMIIDDADQSLLTFHSFLPKDWDILITSREELGFKSTFKLGFLSEENALELFHAHCELYRDAKLVSDIIHSVDFHTLSIELLAKTAAKKRRTLPLADLWKRVQRQGLKLEKKVDISSSHSRQHKIEKVFPYVCAIFQSYQLAEEEKLLLLQLACLPSAFHTFDDLKHWLVKTRKNDIESLEETLELLKSRGWLAYDKIVDGFKMHRILQDVVLEQLEISPKYFDSLLGSITGLLSYKPGDDPIQKFRWISFGERIAEVLDGASTKELALLQDNIAVLLRVQGKYSEALRYLEKAIGLLDSSDPYLGTLYNNIGAIYRDVGNAEMALGFDKKALKVFEHEGNPLHLAAVLNNIALDHSSLGQYDKALKKYQQAISTLLQVRDGKELYLASCYHNIAEIYRLRGNYNEARQFLEMAMAIQEDKLEDNHLDLSKTYCHIAMVFKEMEHYEKAIEFYQKDIKICLAVLGPYHPDLATSYDNVAQVYVALEQYQEALRYHDQGLEIRKKNLDLSHPELGTSYNNIAIVYLHQEDYERALFFNDKAIDIYEKSLAENHHNIGVVNYNRGLIFRGLRNYETAENLLSKSLSILSTSLGSNHSFIEVIKEVLNDLHGNSTA